MNLLWLGSRHGLNNFEQIAIVFVLVAVFISLGYAWSCVAQCSRKTRAQKKCRKYGMLSELA